MTEARTEPAPRALTLGDVIFMLHTTFMQMFNGDNDLASAATAYIINSSAMVRGDQ